jgi:simple sugar transport system ATP-binding protein
MTAEKAVEAVGIHKRFGSTHALRGVDLTLTHGRCLGLVGRNGAGKSTMVSIVSGLASPDEGSITRSGPIATVFQHSMVVPQLTVAENVFLGELPGRRGAVDWRRMRERTSQVMAEWGFEISATQPCSSLTVEQRQVVEIARALAAGTRCLLLDEPTAALERGAVQRLFERVRQLVASGVAVLYISHHLEEVFEICSDVAVLRDGQRVLAAPVTEVTKADLVTAMVGGAKAVDESSTAIEGGRSYIDRSEEETGAALLKVEEVSGAGLQGVSFRLRRGERVGLTGLRGSGALQLARVVAGALAQESGSVTLEGRRLPPGNRTAALRAGVGYIPEDRQADGFVPLLSVAENATMTIVDRLARWGFVAPRARAAAAAPLARRLSVVSSGLGQPTGELSGGNQQKVTVARALARDPKLIVAITPTRGVDVASKEALLGELDRVSRETGAGLVLASDELDDLAICDRVLVLVRGQVFTEFTDPPFDQESLIAASEGMEARS